MLLWSVTVFISNWFSRYYVCCLLSSTRFAGVNSTVGLIFQQLVFHKPTIAQLANGVTL